MSRMSLCAFWLACAPALCAGAPASEPPPASALEGLPALPASAGDTQTVAVRHDPFNRDAIRETVRKQSAAAEAAAAAATSTAATSAAATPIEAPVQAAPKRMPVLRAVLHGTSRSMANVDGVLLEPGQSIDGYRLIEIGEFGARFVKNGRSVELPLGAGATP